jgi:hypothetical protein
MTRHSLAIVSPDDQKVTFVELFFDLSMRGGTDEPRLKQPALLTTTGTAV